VFTIGFTITTTVITTTCTVTSQTITSGITIFAIPACAITRLAALAGTTTCCTVSVAVADRACLPNFPVVDITHQYAGNITKGICIAVNDYSCTIVEFNR
jgi:hypothetical protein